LKGKLQRRGFDSRGIWRTLGKREMSTITMDSFENFLPGDKKKKGGKGKGWCNEKDLAYICLGRKNEQKN